MDRSQILKGSTLCLSGPLVRFSRPETLKTLPNEKKSTKPSNFQTRFLYVPICQVVSDISHPKSRFRVKMTCWADIHFKFDLKSFFGTQSVHSDHKTTFRALNLPSNHHLSWGNRGIPCSDRQPHPRSKSVEFLENIPPLHIFGSFPRGYTRNPCIFKQIRWNPGYLSLFCKKKKKMNFMG